MSRYPGGLYGRGVASGEILVRALGPAKGGRISLAGNRPTEGFLGRAQLIIARCAFDSRAPRGSFLS